MQAAFVLRVLSYISPSPAYIFEESRPFFFDVSQLSSLSPPPVSLETSPSALGARDECGAHVAQNADANKHARARGTNRRAEAAKRSIARA